MMGYETRILEDLHCPDCAGKIITQIEGDFGNWIKIWVYCEDCGRKWHIIYTGTGSMD